MSDHHHEQRIHITLDFSGLMPLVEALDRLIVDRHILRKIADKLDAVHAVTQELKVMSGNLSDQEAAAAARSEAALANIATEVQAIAAELKAGTGNVGDRLSQAMVDRNAAIATSLEGVATSLGALIPASTGSHTAADPNETAANGATMNDGVTLRNQFTLPGFNPNAAETA